MNTANGFISSPVPDGAEGSCKKSYPAKLEAFDEAQKFVERALEAAECPLAALNRILISFEELFVNVASYAYPDGEGTVEVELSCRDGRAVITLKDYGIPFDPLKKPDPDVSQPVADRAPGGLGIFMTKKMMDSVIYRREGDANIITIEKSF